MTLPSAKIASACSGGLGGTLFPPANNAVKLVLNVLFRAVDDTSLRHVMGMSRSISGELGACTARGAGSVDEIPFIQSLRESGYNRAYVDCQAELRNCLESSQAISNSAINPNSLQQPRFLAPRPPLAGLDALLPQNAKHWSVSAWTTFLAVLFLVREQHKNTIFESVHPSVPPASQIRPTLLGASTRANIAPPRPDCANFRRPSDIWLKTPGWIDGATEPPVFFGSQDEIILTMLTFNPDHPMFHPTQAPGCPATENTPSASLSASSTTSIDASSAANATATTDPAPLVTDGAPISFPGTAGYQVSVIASYSAPDTSKPASFRSKPVLKAMTGRENLSAACARDTTP
ncbi:hypothetical protein B0H10DRAFT_1960167 [Mycena sp. CBHHK59/15]|nr:hypothetical protein B0H10DRAFT_1960167 [Mycena sp. CBHHK59/15]